MKSSDLKVLVFGLIIAGIIWFVTRKKKEEKTINVRPYKRTITVKGHSKSKPKPKAKSKNRRSVKR
jgi:hypothetical protein